MVSPFVFHDRWLVGVSYRIITYKDPVPSLEQGKRAIAQLAPVPGAIYLSRGSMTAESPSIAYSPILPTFPDNALLLVKCTIKPFKDKMKIHAWLDLLDAKYDPW